MDRFLMHLYIDYGTEEAEGEIVGLVRSEERAKLEPASGESEPAASPSATEAPEQIQQASVFEARRAIGDVSVSEVVLRYLVDLVFATRYPDRYSEDLRRWIQVGASPRGALALDKCARARAWLAGRDHVIPDDIRDVAPDCLRHRLTLSYEASAEGVSASDVVDELLTQVAVA
jgi:MoxR-like ATPase